MARGLSTAELKSIRDTLASGRRPKVMFTESAGQIAGQTGQVTKLTDPGLSDEWVVVKFGHDELPFSPTDLAVPSRSVKAPGKREPASRAAEAVSAPEFKVVRETIGQRHGNGSEQHNNPSNGSAAGASPPDADAPSGGAPADGATNAGTPGAGTAKGGTSATGTTPAPSRSASGTSGAAAEIMPPSRESAGRIDAAPVAKPPRKAAGRPGKPKPIPGLTVTVAYSDGEWTVAANQGSRALAKPYVIKATDALRMVALLDVPGVHEAVEQIVSTERAEAEAEAERLRGQLAQIEERLAELRDAG